MSHYLLVYGTLKRRSRHAMARRLAESALHVGGATIAGRLYNLGRFPGLKEPRSGIDWVQGDVYDLGANADHTLHEMDAYENAESPPPYERQLATVVLADGREMTVWVYWYRGAVSEEQFIAAGSYEDNCDPPSEPEA
ncbi:MAG: gamma-glutamylcyclotransferase [Gemmataceae bacterium]|nr:gamma-glutamylcyclotransferase [Gemmataceae bacterium]